MHNQIQGELQSGIKALKCAEPDFMIAADH